MSYGWRVMQTALILSTIEQIRGLADVTVTAYYFRDDGALIKPGTIGVGHRGVSRVCPAVADAVWV